MRYQPSVLTVPLAFVLAGGLFATPAAAQSHSTAPKKWTTPRTPEGHPDLQGIWSNATITPFERPRELGARNSSR